jgi:hypothetical protein
VCGVIMMSERAREKGWYRKTGDGKSGLNEGLGVHGRASNVREFKFKSAAIRKSRDHSNHSLIDQESRPGIAFLS